MIYGDGTNEVRLNLYFAIRHATIGIAGFDSHSRL
jgi:hypothetical protein